MRQIALAAAVLVVLGASRVQAAPTSYAVDFSTLYSVDLATATATPIGPVGERDTPEGLALSPGGALFGTDASGNLYIISSTTGAATFIGDTGLGDIEGLTFRGSTLIGTDFSGQTSLYALDTATAAPTLLVTTNPGQGVARSLTLLDSNTGLFASDSPPNSSLVTVDLSTGSTTVLSTFVGYPNDQPAAIASIGGTLYGLAENGDEYLINPNTGGFSLVGNTGGQVWLDMTTASAVPEPSSLALAGLGGVALLGYARRHRTHS